MISSSPPAQAQDHSQGGFEHLQRRRLLSLSGQPVLGLPLLHSKEDFPHIQMAVLCFSLCLSQGTTVPLLLTPALKVFVGIHWFHSQLSLLQS